MKGAAENLKTNGQLRLLPGTSLTSFASFMVSDSLTVAL
jgi:hypothetical protein